MAYYDEEDDVNRAARLQARLQAEERYNNPANRRRVRSPSPPSPPFIRQDYSPPPPDAHPFRPRHSAGRGYSPPPPSIPYYNSLPPPGDVRYSSPPPGIPYYPPPPPPVRRGSSPRPHGLRRYSPPPPPPYSTRTGDPRSRLHNGDFTYQRLELLGLSKTYYTPSASPKDGPESSGVNRSTLHPEWSEQKAVLQDGLTSELLLIHSSEHIIRKDGQEKIQLVYSAQPRAQSDSPNVQFRWLHLQRYYLSVDVLERIVVSSPFISPKLKPVALMALEDAKKQLSQWSGKGSSGDLGCAVRCVGKYDSHNDPDNQSVIFLASPYVSLNKAPSVKPSKNGHQMMTLLQTLYGYDVNQSHQDRQVVERMKAGPAGGSIHVPQLWSLLIGSDILITFSEFSMLEIQGDLIDLNSNTSGIQSPVTIQVIYSDQSRSNIVIDAGCSYVDFLRHAISLIRRPQADATNYELYDDDDNLLTPLRWLKHISSRKTDGMKVYIRSRYMSSERYGPRPLARHQVDHERMRHLSRDRRRSRDTSPPYRTDSPRRQRSSTTYVGDGIRVGPVPSYLRRSDESRLGNDYSEEDDLIAAPVLRSPVESPPIVHNPGKRVDFHVENPTAGQLISYNGTPAFTGPAPGAEGRQRTASPKSYDASTEPKARKALRNPHNSYERRIASRAPGSVPYYDSRVRRHSMARTRSQEGVIVNDWVSTYGEPMPEVFDAASLDSDRERAQQRRDTPDNIMSVPSRRRRSNQARPPLPEATESSYDSISTEANIDGSDDDSNIRTNAHSMSLDVDLKKKEDEAKTRTSVRPPVIINARMSERESLESGSMFSDLQISDEHSIDELTTHGRMGVMKHPFFTWKLKGGVGIDRALDPDRNAVQVLSKLLKLISSDSIMKLYEYPFFCTQDDILSRHGDALGTKNPRPSSPILQDAPSKSDGLVDGEKFNMASQTTDRHHNSPVGTGSGEPSRPTLPNQKGRFRSAYVEDEEPELDSGKPQAPKASANTSNNAQWEKLEKQRFVEILNRDQVVIKGLVETSQELLGAFIPKEGSVLIHQMCKRFWGTVDDIIRQIVWSDIDTRPAVRWVVRRFPRPSLLPGLFLSQRNKQMDFSACKACLGQTTYDSHKEALEHLHSQHMQCVHHRNAKHEQVTNDDPCFAWLATVNSISNKGPNQVIDDAEEFVPYLLAIKSQANEVHSLVASTATQDSDPSKRPSLPSKVVFAFEEIVNMFMCTAMLLSWTNKAATPNIDDRAKRRALLQTEKMRRLQRRAYRRAWTFLEDSKRDVILLGTSTGKPDILGQDAIGPEFLVAALSVGLQNKPLVSETNLSILDLYHNYANQLQFESHRRPQRRVFLDIHALEEELQALQSVFLSQEKLLSDYLELLDPASYRVTSASRQSMFQIEAPYIQQQLYKIQSRLRDDGILGGKAGWLKQQVKQMIEILDEGHGKAIRVFTIVTLLFLPLSFTTSFFGMNTSDIRDMDAKQALFWAVSVPLTALVLALAFIYGYKGDAIYDRLEMALRSRHQRHQPRQIPEAPVRAGTWNTMTSSVDKEPLDEPERGVSSTRVRSGRRSGRRRMKSDKPAKRRS